MGVLADERRRFRSSHGSGSEAYRRANEGGVSDLDDAGGGMPDATRMPCEEPAGGSPIGVKESAPRPPARREGRCRERHLGSRGRNGEDRPSISVSFDHEQHIGRTILPAIILTRRPKRRPRTTGSPAGTMTP